MRRILTVASLILAMLPASAQDKLDAAINDFSEVFKMDSPTSGTDKVHKSVTVFNEDGLLSASFVAFTDAFRSVGSFSGEVVLANGKKVKLSKKDLSFSSMSLGIADDSYAVYLTPVFNYPFTVTYDYTIEYRDGIVIFPIFQPLLQDNVSLKSASYTLMVPPGTEISEHSVHLDYSFEFDSKRDIHKWTIKDMAPLVDEHLMKFDSDFLPMLYAVPVEFSYGGIKGRQSDWKELGAWLNSLQDKADDLPESEIAKVKELTAGADSEFETVSRLYSYLKEKTRYVSIQLGIGGYRTLPASHVVKTGFGDCKALSNYMKSMLKVAGIESNYYVIHMDREDFFGNLPSPGQMNHAMLAVPLKENGDTLFVECTNPSFPLGYRHSSCARHEILLLDGEGGQKVRIGGYPDSLSRKTREARIALREDGSAHIDIKDKRMLDYSEALVNFSSRKPEDQVKFLIRDWMLQPENVKIDRISDNFDRYPEYGRDFVPEAEVDFSMESRNYASKNGDRLFFPVNPLAKSFYYQRSERVNRIYRKEAFTLVDDYSVVIPEGYKVESLPADASFESVWGSFKSSVKVDEIDGTILHINQTLVVPCFDEPASEYPSYRDFSKKINKLYSAKIVVSKR